MKLIRLTAEGNKNGFLRNTFNEDILIKEGSKIALQSLFIKKDLSDVVIDNGDHLCNVNFYDNVGDSVPQYVIPIISRDYYNLTSNNVSVLSKVLTNIFNSSLIIYNGNIFNDFMAGLEFEVSIDTKNLLNISLKKSPLGNGDIILSTHTQKSGNDYIDNAGANGTYDKFVCSSKRLCGGNMVIRSRLYDSNGTTENKGVLIGFTDNKYSAHSTNINIKSLEYGVNIRDGKAYLIMDGEENGHFEPISINGVGDVTNDEIEITLDGLQATIRIYRNGLADPILLDENPLEINYNYREIFFLSAWALNNDGISACEYTISPFDGSNVSTSLTVTPPDFLFERVYSNISFIKEGLADVLGFKDDTTRNGSSDDWIYGAAKKTKFVSKNQGYIVELQNINLDCYDGYTDETGNGARSIQGRKSILSIPMKEHDVEEFNFFNPAALSFFDINHYGDLLLREVVLRVYNLDYVPIETSGFSQAVIVIKGKDEI